MYHGIEARTPLIDDQLVEQYWENFSDSESFNISKNYLEISSMITAYQMYQNIKKWVLILKAL